MFGYARGSAEERLAGYGLLPNLLDIVLPLKVEDDPLYTELGKKYSMATHDQIVGAIERARSMPGGESVSLKASVALWFRLKYGKTK